MDITTRKHPETGETLYATRRRDGSVADSAWVWENADGSTVLDPTDDEDQALSRHFDTDRSIADR